MISHPAAVVTLAVCPSAEHDHLWEVDRADSTCGTHDEPIYRLSYSEDAFNIVGHPLALLNWASNLTVALLDSMELNGDMIDTEKLRENDSDQ